MAPSRAVSVIRVYVRTLEAIDAGNAGRSVDASPHVAPSLSMLRRSFRTSSSLCAVALLVSFGAVGCGDPDDECVTPACFGPPEEDAGGDVDAEDTSTGADGDQDDAAPSPDACEGDDCPPEATACDGLDLDGDGTCDRDRADWSAGASVEPGTHRADIYGLGDRMSETVTRGIEHTLVWPIDISGSLLPWRPMAALLDPDTEDANTRSLQSVVRNSLGFGTLPEMYTWLGLAYAQLDRPPMAGVEWPSFLQEGDPLGAGLVETQWGPALTYSCATCHSAELFGRTVYGLSNRRAQANEYFHAARTFFPALRPALFETITGADETELELFLRTQKHLNAVGSRLPMVRGLDTSLAQVSLSLARRGEDPQATRDPALERTPRPNQLSDYVADSKPAVWWTLRYKTRWLSDGSIVSGNPIFTNFLWNELGRGTDLDALLEWLQDNRTIIDELTVAAFAAEAPRWEEFFGVDSIDIEAAQRGELLFEATCAECHGSYTKGWSASDAETRTAVERLQNVRLDYHAQTPVFDVGTDPQRALGMAAFGPRLNELEISQWMETVVEVTGGYVPPPLDGIWARYPYLHNHSVPSLCEMLLPSELRSSVFWMGPDQDPETDFDLDCVGFPVGDRVPDAWKEEERNRFDTSIDGLRNTGHDAWLRTESGEPRFDADQRRDLVEFLKTL